MRALFTAGILDVLLENGVRFDGMIGVSAGATFGCNFKSRQVGRALRYNMRFIHDPRLSKGRVDTPWLLFPGSFQRSHSKTRSSSLKVVSTSFT